MKNLGAFWVILLTVVLTPFLAISQRDWTVPYKSEQVFIQNLGQYDGIVEGSQVHYGIDHGFGWKVLMTDNGARLISQKGTRPQEAHEMGAPMAVQTTIVGQEWMGIDPAMVIEAEDMRPDYFTYSYETTSGFQNVDQAPAWNRLRYRGIYPGIDLEYTGPELGGLKYSLTLQPGADASRIRMQYTGTPVSLDGSGNLVLPTVLGDLVDHAPSARYLDGAQESIPCAFVLIGNEVSFDLGNYNPSRPVEIDPWTVNPALPAPFNRAFEVDADAAGNVYVFGGGMGYNLKKYNAAGTLQWTHVSPWDTSNAWFGELLVMPAGDIFITSGSAAKIRRLTTAGATTFTNNGPFFNLDEYWSLSLNCDNTKLLAAGSRIIGFTSPQGHLFNLNLANGNQLAGSPINLTPTGMNELRCINRSSSNGLLFALSNNNLVGITNALTTTFNISNGYTMPYYSPAYMAQSVQGVNAVGANATALYTSNGLVLQARNPGTGAVISSVNIPSGGFTSGFFGSGATNSGLSLDNCGNVYVGSTNQVVKYNGSLVQQATVATTGAVYDVHVAPGGVVIWGGNGFLTSNTSLAACAQQTYNCVVLPVELEYFRAECKEEGSFLQWSASKESEGLTYIVEHSPNGSFWEKLSEFEGEGAGKTYEFQSPAIQQDWFYRLKIVDAEGQDQYSFVQNGPACGNKPQSIVAWPTQAEENVNVMMELPTSGTVKIELRDAWGRVVKMQRFQADSGPVIQHIDLTGLPAGIYWIRVSDGVNEFSGNARIIKK